MEGDGEGGTGEGRLREKGDRGDGCGRERRNTYLQTRSHSQTIYGSEAELIVFQLVYLSVTTSAKLPHHNRHGGSFSKPFCS